MPSSVARHARAVFAGLALLLATMMVALTPAVTRAQFDTPNRQFHNETSFPLEGRHRTVECESCHINTVYKGTPNRCFDCHWTRRQDDRYRLQLGAQCEQCHRPAAWTAVRFQHAEVSSGFQLVGRHAQTSCINCHRGNVYRGTARTCEGCHLPAYAATKAPNHQASGFPTTCDTCHRASDSAWTQGRFDHAQIGFPLAGRHSTTTCASCHVNNVYRGTSRACSGCHLPLYQRTTSPSHVAAGFPTTCDNCHRATDTSWTQGRFDHRFPITSGPHRQPCSACHQSSTTFQTFSCVGCHQRGTTDEHHREVAGYRYDSLACYSCHPNGRN